MKGEAIKTKPYHPDAFSNRRFLISLSILLTGTVLAGVAAIGSSTTSNRLLKSKSAAGAQRSSTAAGGVPNSGQNFWTANERTAGRRWHRISEKLGWTSLCRDARSRRFPFELTTAKSGRELTTD
jgi:hypothetical protein